MIVPVILCGGSGTRLWPVSRRSYPKQFSKLIGNETLFQACVKRFESAQFSAPIIITHAEFRFIVAEQLKQIGVTPMAILLEPESRNTAPAVLAASLFAHKDNRNAKVLIAPSDHLIPDTEAFGTAIARGARAAEDARIITFGVQPTHPETGYGYLEVAQELENGHSDVRALKRFVEKPTADNASAMLESGSYLWNAGIFLFRSIDMLEAFRTHAPHMIAPVQRALDESQSDLDFCRLSPGCWAMVEEISIDYAIMEKATNLAVVPYHHAWSDLGDWHAVWRELKSQSTDQGGDPANLMAVETHGNVTALDCKTSLLRAHSDDMELVGIGLENIVAIAMKDAVLIADMSQAQKVTDAVNALKTKQVRQATEFPKKHRPWGWFETLLVDAHFQVNRVRIDPGASLSLHRHHYRSEHWFVLQGQARLEIDGEPAKILNAFQSAYIALDRKHRLSNPSDEPVILIETQTGLALDENDVIRYQGNSQDNDPAHTGPDQFD